MNELNTNNNTLTDMTSNIVLAQTNRDTAVQVIIKSCIEHVNKEKEVNTASKKTLLAQHINKSLNGGKLDKYAKRALKIAKIILVDGYTLKKELLSLAQMEQLSTFNKNVVNALVVHNGDVYINKAKELINSAKIDKTTKVFSKKQAKEIKLKDAPKI